MSDFVSANCKCRSVSCDAFRASVTWTQWCVCARVTLCGCIFVCCLWFWLLNDERRGCVRGYAPICEQWTPYRSCALWLTNKIAHAMMSEQLAEGENKVQLASVWGQNALLDGLGRCLWDQEPTLLWPKRSQGRLPQFRHSILEAFWASFWKTLEAKTASQDEVCFRYTFGFEIWWKKCRFWYQIQTE